MSKKKMNIISNKLDQAPKTKKAGYRKTIDAMKGEMVEALNSTNIPNIISNESDQAPKTRAAWYQKVLDELTPEINKAMEQIFMNGPDEIFHYIDEHRNELPIYAIINLKPWEKVAFEIKREPIIYNWFTETVWHPAFAGDFPNFSWFLTRNWEIKPWEKSLIIVVEASKNDEKFLNIHAEQLEIPWKNAMLMSWMFFHNPNVSGEKFNKIINTKTPTNPTNKETETKKY